jgi:hypothetical protein
MGGPVRSVSAGRALVASVGSLAAAIGLATAWSGEPRPAPLAQPAQPETILFLVAETDPVHGDSYVLPLTDPQDVADARALIAQGPASGIGPIVSAHIVAGTDGLNRDYRNPAKPAWSWHVDRFDGFAEAAIELCDGWPGYVEEDVQRWIQNTAGAICFWDYTVVEELGPVPARPGTWGMLKQRY